MPLSTPTLAAIQSAGAAVFAAEAELRAVAQRYADQVQAALRDAPFDAGNDGLFEDWKTAARLAQALRRTESELRQMYELAARADVPGLAVAASMPSLTASAGRVERLQDIDATDVRIKRVPSVGAGRQLKGNSAKVMARLLQVLPARGAVKVNRSALARDSGLPKGSINAALAQLMQKGYIVQGQAGELRLG